LVVRIKEKNNILKLNKNIYSIMEIFIVVAKTIFILTLSVIPAKAGAGAQQRPALSGIHAMNTNTANR
jgi:hypothetical protein